MALPPVAYWLDVMGSYNAQQDDRLRQDTEGLEFVIARDVIHDPAGELVTRPGFSKVRSSAIASSLSFTGIHHMWDLATEDILTMSDGTFKRNNANPPGALAGGTAFTSGVNVLTRSTLYNNFLIVVSNARDLPQTVNASATP